MALVLSTFIPLCMNSWVMVWVFLEINSMIMCFLISKETKIYNMKNNPTLMYLMVQMLSSMIMILSINMMSSHSEMILIMMMILKMGAWPCHTWYLKTLSMMNMKMSSMLTIMSWQKILPLYLMYCVGSNMILLTTLSMISILAPTSGLKKDISFKSLIVLSSLNNNGWLILSLLSSIYLCMMFLSVYTMSLILTFKTLKHMSLKNMLSMKNFIEVTLILSNMSGVPPFMMFFSKVLMLFYLSKSLVSTEVLMIIMVMACYFMYNYLWAFSWKMANLPKKSQMSETPKNNMLLASLTIIMSPLLIFMIILG